MVLVGEAVPKLNFGPGPAGLRPPRQHGVSLRLSELKISTDLKMHLKPSIQLENAWQKLNLDSQAGSTL